MNTKPIIVPKPEHYKNHFIVNDPNPKLIVSLTNTVFQPQMDLSKDEWREFEAELVGDNIVITEVED